MRHSYRPTIPPKPQLYRTQVLDHLGLVAGMFEELGITEVIDQATQQDPEMRIVTAGHAVKAMVLNGLGFINQQLYLVPHFFQNKPISRLIAPGIQASHLNDDTLGRTLDTLYEAGVTALYSLIAATAAKRLGLIPTWLMLDSRGVMGQVWHNRLFLQAFHEGHDRWGILGKSCLISSTSVLYWVCKTPESNMSLIGKPEAHLIMPKKVA